MSFRVDTYSAQVEHRVLTGLVVHADFLALVYPRREHVRFPSRSSELVARLCFDYYGKHRRAPGRDVESLLQGWADGHRGQEDLLADVEQQLATMSEHYQDAGDDLNLDHLQDEANRLFREVHLAAVLDGSRGLLDRGDLEGAERMVADFSVSSFKVSPDTHPLRDREQVLEAFKRRKRKPLVRYGGALLNFFDRSLDREQFVAFLAPEKRGKTTFLVDLAWRAVAQGRNVIFFGIGDSSKNQLLMRFSTRAVRHPLRSTNQDHSWPCTVNVPTHINPPERDPVNNTAEVSYEERYFEEALEGSRASDRFDEVARGLHSGYKLKVVVHASRGISASGIRTHLEDLSHAGWVPDVVVVDYVDNLAPEPSAAGFDYRNQINETWKALSGLRLDLHCLLVTATQSDASSYNRWLLGADNFSNDKRKNAEVTALYGINQTREEKRRGVFRVNCILLRDDDFDPGECVYLAGCLPLANPAVLSVFGSRHRG